MAGKFWTALLARINKFVNLFWASDPIAIMRLEYDRAVAEIQEGRQGLEQYRGLVESVNRQVLAGRANVERLEAKVKAYLKAGDRESAGREALALQHAKAQLVESERQLAMHEEAYGNNLKKIQHASRKLAEMRQRIDQHEADLKMSEAEAAIAQVAEALDIKVGENLTSTFGEVEAEVQARIDRNRGKARVAADMSSRGLEQIQAEERLESTMAEEALRNYEIELGLVTPETTPVPELQKTLGSAQETVKTEEA